MRGRSFILLLAAIGAAKLLTSIDGGERHAAETSKGGAPRAEARATIESAPEARTAPRRRLEWQGRMDWSQEVKRIDATTFTDLAELTRTISDTVNTLVVDTNLSYDEMLAVREDLRRIEVEKSSELPDPPLRFVAEPIDRRDPTKGLFMRPEAE